MTKQELKAKIDKLENGIKSKATPSNLIAPLKAQKAKLEKELEEMESAEKKAVKTKKVSKVAEKIKAAKKSVAKKTPAKAPAKEERKKDNIARDGDRKSLPSGKRISKTGKVYYETRANRSDKQTSVKPYLADGGETDGWKKSRTRKLKTREEAEKAIVKFSELMGRAGRNYKVEKMDDGYVISYESNYEPKMADGGEVKWQDVNFGDSALVISENKMGLVIKPYGRKFHLKFADGSEKTYDAKELQFFQDKMAKGGTLKVYDSENSYRLSRPSGSIEKELLKNVSFSEEDFVGNFGWKTTAGKLADGYLYNLDESDQELVKGIKLKEGEKIYRYFTRTTAIGGIKPLIKINLDKGLLYFPILQDNEDIVFETRGIQAMWVSLIGEKMAKGGTLNSPKFLEYYQVLDRWAHYRLTIEKGKEYYLPTESTIEKILANDIMFNDGKVDKSTHDKMNTLLVQQLKDLKMNAYPEYAKGGELKKAQLLIIDSSNPLSTQLKKLTGDFLNSADFKDIGSGNFNILTHKRTNKVFIVYQKHIYNSLPEQEKQDDINYLKNVEKIKLDTRSMADGGETDGHSYGRLKGFESQDWEKMGREYAGSEWDNLSKNEKDEIITDLQKDWNRNTSFAHGGKIKNQYEGKTAKEVWDNLSKEQRQHFLYDHKQSIEDYRGEEYGELKSKEIIAAYNSDWDKLDKNIKNRFDNHVREGQYAHGGYVIFEGHDHYNDKPLYKVISKDEDNDYEGEFHDNREDAEKELNELKNKDMNYANGGKIYGEQSIKDFYINTYPTDDLGQKINGEATFDGLNKVLDCNIDVYEYLGVGDSLVRERVFEKLAEIDGVNYDVIYDKWLASDSGDSVKLNYGMAKEYINPDYMADGGEVNVGDIYKDVRSEQKLEIVKVDEPSKEVTFKIKDSLYTISKFSAEHNLNNRIWVKQGGYMAYGGKTKSRKSIKDLTIEQISSLSGVGKSGVERFSDENNLTEDDLSNIMQGLGRRMISASDFATAVLGEKDNQYSREIIDFAKSGKGYKMADGGQVDKELIDSSAKSIYDRKGMMGLRNTFLQVAKADEDAGDKETAEYRRKVVSEYQAKQPKFMANGGQVPAHFGSGKNIEVFGYETKHFDICGTAVKEFEAAVDIMKDSKELEKESLAYCAKYVDNLFGIEKGVVEGGIGGELNFSHAVSDIMSAATYNFRAGMAINLYSFVPQHLMEIALRLAKAEKGGLYALGGMTAGRWYRDKSGEEFKFIGRVDSGANKGRFLFTDGQKSVYKDLEEFEGSKPKETKLFGFFEDGGSVAEGNYEMLMSNIKAIKHHAEELAGAVTPDTEVEAWVLSKSERAETDLSDITHYLDGLKMEKGGYMAEGGELGKETITLKSYNIYGKEINSGDVIVDYDNKTIELPSGKTYKVENDYKYTIKALKSKIKASGGINGLVKFLKEINTSDSPFNPSFTNQLINGFDKYAEGGELNSIKEEYLKNEDENAHSENVVLLAKHFGTKEDLAEAKRILALHEKEGHLSSENGKKRQQLHLKLIDKATKEMAKEGIEFEKGGYMAEGGLVVKSDEDIREVAKYMAKAVKKRWDLKDLVYYFEQENNYDYKYRVKIWDEMNVWEMKKTEENIYKVLKAIVEANEQGGVMAEGGELEMEEFYLYDENGKKYEFYKKEGDKYMFSSYKVPFGKALTIEKSELQEKIKDGKYKVVASHAKGGETNYTKKWKVLGITMQGKRFEKEITLGRMSDRNDVMNALKRMPDTQIREVTFIGERFKAADGGYMAQGGETSSKNFNTQYNVGKAKYVINYHDGKKTHKDGSPFYDLATFKNMKDFMAYKKKLKSEGYKEYKDGGYMAKGGEVEFVNSNLYLNGFGMDSNGNKVVKVSFPNQRAFSIQTNGVLNETNNLYTKNIGELTEAEIKTIEKEVVEYVKQFGSKEQKQRLKTYSGYMAKGGKVKFADKVKAVQESLLKRKKVSPQVQKDYGKTYNKAEAKESAQRIVGSRMAQLKEKMAKKKMAKGGTLQDQYDKLKKIENEARNSYYKARDTDKWYNTIGNNYMLKWEKQVAKLKKLDGFEPNYNFGDVIA